MLRYCFLPYVIILPLFNLYTIIANKHGHFTLNILIEHKYFQLDRSSITLNTERSYKRQGHATLKHFVGFFCATVEAEITVA